MPSTAAPSNQRGEVVIDGEAEVIAPTKKYPAQRVVLPEVELRRRGRQYERLIEKTRGLDPIRTAVVHPVDTPPCSARSRRRRPS